MAKLIGPDFISLQAQDLAAARAFYGDLLGLPILRETPDVVVFNAAPIPFAVRKPVSDLGGQPGGAGIALWFGCDDVDGLHALLTAQGIAILAAPQHGPFGRNLTFSDPFGYAITAHAVLPAA